LLLLSFLVCNLAQTDNIKQLLNSLIGIFLIFQILNELKETSSNQDQTKTNEELTENQVLLLDYLNKVAKSFSKLSKSREILAPNLSDSLRIVLAISADENLRRDISEVENVRVNPIKKITVKIYQTSFDIRPII